MTKQYSVENRMVVDSEWADKEPTPVCYCEGCGEGIFAGDFAYHYDGWWHEDCFWDYMRQFWEEVME